MGADAAVAEPEQKVEEQGPTDEGAEATRPARHLFQYSMSVHAGAGAEDCDDPIACKDPGHFHGWISLPNRIQQEDITAKARAAAARRKRALRDAGAHGRPAADAYVTLEAELDELLAGDRTPILEQLSNRKARERAGETLAEIREEERFEHYDQDAEEYRRQKALPEEDRDAEEFKRLDEEMTAFGDALDRRIEELRQADIAGMANLDDAALRIRLREARIEADANDAWNKEYFLWLGYVSTKVPLRSGASKRYFESFEAFKSAAPEAIEVVDEAIHELESRFVRGDGTGN